jgi:hypothetical protein
MLKNDQETGGDSGTNQVFSATNREVATDGNKCAELSLVCGRISGRNRSDEFAGKRISLATPR